MADFLPSAGIVTTAFGLLGVFVFFMTLILIAKSLRIVVGTNDVHIVQSTHSTQTYGKGQTKGNVYYKWPSWFPGIGVQVTQLPVSVYSLALNDYAAYDKGRVPFIIDIIGFFRVDAPLVASERIATFDELKRQMTGILQGAIRSILASSEIESILEGRAEFGKMFTEAVDDQLKNWGITSVKSIELMDIRDAQGSQVIANIMAKKKSHIEMESRIEVAGNIQKAAIAEVEAKRQVGLAEQEAAEQVGKRTADKELAIGVATEKATQGIKEQEAITADKAMSVNKVNQVRQAEINKEVQLVAANQQKEVAIVQADGTKQQAILNADGVLYAKQKEADGILFAGTAKAESERLLLMAPVSAQTTLAKEIGENEGYQKYLVVIRQIEAGQVVGVEQAKALEKAGIKVIANTGGGVVDGVKSVMDLFSAKGGLQLGAALEGFAQTDAGKAVLARVAPGEPSSRPVRPGSTTNGTGSEAR